MSVTNRTAARMRIVPITRPAPAATAGLAFTEMVTIAFLMVSSEILIGAWSRKDMTGVTRKSLGKDV